MLLGKETEEKQQANSFALLGGCCSKKRSSLDFCKDRRQIGPAYRTMKMSGSESTAPRILNLGTR